MAITQTITPLPVAPDPSMSEEDFDAHATEFTAALPPLVTEINALAGQINAESANVNTKATAAATSEANALASKNAAATSATNAATSANASATAQTAAETAKTAAETAKTAAAASQTDAATSATNAAASAVYAKSRIDHVIAQQGLAINDNDATQLKTAIDLQTNLLGGSEGGGLACIFKGKGGTGDFASKVASHPSFGGAGYLHLKINDGGLPTMPIFYIRGFEWGTLNEIDETSMCYYYLGYIGYNGVYNQKHKAGGANTPFFYKSSDGKFVLRIKINSATYITLRIDAMDAYQPNPLTCLTVISGLLTPASVETI